jgi:hypothetical protein
MLKILLLLLASSVLATGQINSFYGPVFTILWYSSTFLGHNSEIVNLMFLLGLHTGIPAIGFDFSNLTELMNFIGSSHFSLGFSHVDGVLVHAIKIGNSLYSVEPGTFESLIHSLNVPRFGAS